MARDIRLISFVVPQNLQFGCFVGIQCYALDRVWWSVQGLHDVVKWRFSWFVMHEFCRNFSENLTR